jgi:hypothetical protein
MVSRHTTEWQKCSFPQMPLAQVNLLKKDTVLHFLDEKVCFANPYG